MHAHGRPPHTRRAGRRGWPLRCPGPMGGQCVVQARVVNIGRAGIVHGYVDLWLVVAGALAPSVTYSSNFNLLCLGAVMRRKCGGLLAHPLYLIK